MGIDLAGYVYSSTSDRSNNNTGVQVLAELRALTNRPNVWAPNLTAG